MNAGIIGYGVYIPVFRIKVEEIAATWQQNVDQIKSSLLINEKSVPGADEDSATFAVNAAKNAILRFQINPDDINAIYVGSESAPYAVKPTATIVWKALGFNKFCMAADIEFACKAGTAALGVCLGMVKSGLAKCGMAIGTDTAQARPGDILEYSAGAGAAAFVVGADESKIIATIDGTLSVISNTPDFWRRSMQLYPEHAGRFTAEPAYLKHVCEIVQQVFEKFSCGPSDFDFVVFHQPNGKLPLLAAKKLGFSLPQINPGLIVQDIGNAYSASSLLGLACVLGSAKPNQKILVVSYGSGSGCDAFILKTTDLINKRANLKKYLGHKKYLTYSEYRKNMDLLHQDEK